MVIGREENHEVDDLAKSARIPVRKRGRLGPVRRLTAAIMPKSM